MFSDTKKLPPVNTLFRQSWETFQAAWVKLLLLDLVGWGLLALAVILIAIIAAVLGTGGALVNPRIFQNPTALLPLLTGLGVVGFIFLVGMIFIVLLLLQISTIKVVTSSNPKNLPVILTLRNSVQLVWPFFVVSLVGGLMTLGWTALLIIPGIIVAFLLSFWSFAMILDHFKGLDSLRHSLALVKAHFWGIFGRLLLITVLGLGIQVVLSMLVGRNSGETFLSLLVNLVFGWFTLCYCAILYKQARVGMEKSLISLRGLVIGSLIGWVILGLIIYGTIQLTQQSIKTKSPGKTPSDIGQNNPTKGLQEN